jgi:hypothetical protein
LLARDWATYGDYRPIDPDPEVAGDIVTRRYRRSAATPPPPPRASTPTGNAGELDAEDGPWSIQASDRVQAESISGPSEPGI